MGRTRSAQGFALGYDPAPLQGASGTRPTQGFALGYDSAPRGFAPGYDPAPLQGAPLYPAGL